MTHPIAHRLALRAVAQEEAAKVVPKNVPDKHQLKILIDTLKMHPAMAGVMGGPSREEAEEILKKKFNWTDADIHKVKHAADVEAGLGKPDIHGIPVDKAEEALHKQYGADAAPIVKAFRTLLAKFKRSGNSAHTEDGTEFSLVLTKDLKELHFTAHEGNMQNYLANLVPSKEIVDAYKKVYHVKSADLVQRVAERFLAAESEQGSISRPTPSAEAEPEAPDEDEWASYEKRGEWNLIIYHHGGRRNLSYFMKNPQGGGGGSNDGTSVKGLVKQVINHNVGWSNPHINPEKKDKVWVVVVQFTGAGPHWWKPIKEWWEPVPKELLVPKEKKPMTNQEYYERLTR
jgi:hypothetical protein